MRGDVAESRGNGSPGSPARAFRVMKTSKPTAAEIKYLRIERAALATRCERAIHPDAQDRANAALDAFDVAHPTIRRTQNMTDVEAARVAA